MANNYDKECNHPISSVFCFFSCLLIFAGKFNNMFSLGEGHSFYLYGGACDLRKGFSTLCGLVESNDRRVLQGGVYIFINRARTTLKLLHWERGGFVIYHKRLEKGRVTHTIFRNRTSLFYPLRWDELVLLMEGVNPKTKRRKRYNTG